MLLLILQCFIILGTYMAIFFPYVCLNCKLYLNTVPVAAKQYFKYFIRQKKGIFKNICLFRNLICLFKNSTGLILRRIKYT